MKRQMVGATLGALLALASQAANADEKGTLQQLLAENRNLIVQLEKAKKVEGQIAKAELANQGAQSALKHAKEALRREGTGLAIDAASIQQKADQAGCPWGTSSTDIAFVDSCNAEGRRLMALFEDVKKRDSSLQEYAQKLEEKQAQFSERTEKLFAQKKANNADLQFLYDARSNWQRRYNAFVFRSPTYERLKKTAPGAQMCEQLSESGSDQALRSAAQCLQWLWDGARQ
jgi:hypothetical protein